MNFIENVSFCIVYTFKKTEFKEKYQKLLIVLILVENGCTYNISNIPELKDLVSSSNRK